MTARWQITHGGEVVEHGTSPTLETAYDAATDALIDGVRVQYSHLADDEVAVVNATYVNPASVEVRDYLITTELVA